MNDIFKIKPKELTPELFFECASTFGYPQSGTTAGRIDRFVYVSSYHVRDAFHLIRVWANHLRGWDSTFSIIGPVEAKDPLINAEGEFLCLSELDHLAFIYVAGKKPGYSARIRIEPKYIDMIKVSIDDEEHIRVTFYLQIGPAKE